jgi:hypothetical protein
MTDHATAVETTIGAPFETVWRALRDRDAIRRWHGWEYDEIDAIYLQAVDADEAAGTLAMADGSRFALKRAGERTVVRVTTPAPAGDAGWERVYDDIREGWTSFVMQLRFALERHPGEERRTLQLDGAAAAPLDPAAIGLADARDVGDRYQGETAWGERWSGELLFRNQHQAGLTVDG